MRRLTLGLGALLLALAAVVVPATSASAAECAQYNPKTGECMVVIEVPGDPGGGGDSGGDGGGGDDGEGSSEGPCWKLADPQSPPPAGRAEGEGAWYEPCDTSGGGFYVVQWFANPPDGAGITPAQAARIISARLNIQAFEVGMAPQVNPEWGYRRTHVGVPVWMWVANPGPTTYNGYTVSETEAGITVTGSVRVTSIRWDMGDGNSVTCGNAGTPYQNGYGVTESPTCGYLYHQTSESRPGDRYQVTATSQWVFEWQAAGQSGTIPLTTESNAELEVNEMQSVNN